MSPQPTSLASSLRQDDGVMNVSRGEESELETGVMFKSVYLVLCGYKLHRGADTMGRYGIGQIIAAGTQWSS